MKPSSPFWSPSSSSSSSTVDRSPSGSSRIVGPSCIFRILRRILCFTSLPSCPFDHFKGDGRENAPPAAPGGGSGPPGLVARLMGLDSLPQTERIEHDSADSIRQSARSSPQVVSSRRVIPLTYKELEDEHFFILSFDENYSKSKKKKKKKKGVRRRERLREMNKENDPGGINDSRVLCQKEFDSEFKILNESRNVLRPAKNSSQNHGRRRMKETNIEEDLIENEDISDNSSPNSVLEFVELLDDRESTSSGDTSRLENSKLRRTLSEELENNEKSNEKKLINNGFSKQGLRNRQYQILYHAEKLDEARKLAALEMLKSSWDIPRNKDYYKEIGADLASEILQQLLDELL